MATLIIFSSDAANNSKLLNNKAAEASDVFCKKAALVNESFILENLITQFK
jgi:hypothetical protein